MGRPVHCYVRPEGSPNIMGIERSQVGELSIATFDDTPPGNPEQKKINQLLGVLQPFQPYIYIYILWLFKIAMENHHFY